MIKVISDNARKKYHMTEQTDIPRGNVEGVFLLLFFGSLFFLGREFFFFFSPTFFSRGGSFSLFFGISFLWEGVFSSFFCPLFFLGEGFFLLFLAHLFSRGGITGSCSTIIGSGWCRFKKATLSRAISIKHNGTFFQ